MLNPHSSRPHYADTRMVVPTLLLLTSTYTSFFQCFRCAICKIDFQSLPCLNGFAAAWLDWIGAAASFEAFCSSGIYFPNTGIMRLARVRGHVFHFTSGLPTMNLETQWPRCHILAVHGITLQIKCLLIMRWSNIDLPNQVRAAIFWLLELFPLKDRMSKRWKRQMRYKAPRSWRICLQVVTRFTSLPVRNP